MQWRFSGFRYSTSKCRAGGPQRAFNQIATLVQLGGERQKVCYEFGNSAAAVFEGFALRLGRIGGELSTRSLRGFRLALMAGKGWL